MIGAGAVDERIDTSPLFLDLSHETFGGVGIGYIASFRQATAALRFDFFLGLVTLLGTGPIANGDGPTLAGQVEGDGSPNAARAAGDQRNAFGGRPRSTYSSPPLTRASPPARRTTLTQCAQKFDHVVIVALVHRFLVARHVG
jgi:hypothetical protein